MSIPVDLEIAIDRWTLATRLTEIIQEIETTPLAGPNAVPDACWLLGTIIGRLEFLIGELEDIEVEL